MVTVYLVYTVSIVTSLQNIVFHLLTPGPKVIKLFPCSTRLNMKIFLLINIKMPTIVGILTIMGRKNNTLGLSEPEKC